MVLIRRYKILFWTGKRDNPHFIFIINLIMRCFYVCIFTYAKIPEFDVYVFTCDFTGVISESAVIKRGG